VFLYFLTTSVTEIIIMSTRQKPSTASLRLLTSLYIPLCLKELRNLRPCDQERWLQATAVTQLSNDRKSFVKKMLKEFPLVE
jgi:hypothetical protein